MHLLRGIIESGNQETEGTLIKVEICLYSRDKIYRSHQVSRHTRALFGSRKDFTYSRIFPGVGVGVSFLPIYPNLSDPIHSSHLIKFGSAMGITSDPIRINPWSLVEATGSLVPIPFVWDSMDARMQALGTGGSLSQDVLMPQCERWIQLYNWHLPKINMWLTVQTKTRLEIKGSVLCNYYNH